MRRAAFIVAMLAFAGSALADLDTKQKRGSVLNMTQPGRPWLAEPDGTLASTDRMSLMTYASAVAPAAPGGASPSSIFPGDPIFEGRIIR